MFGLKYWLFPFAPFVCLVIFYLEYLAKTSVNCSFCKIEGSNFACRLLFKSRKIMFCNLGSRSNVFATQFFIQFFLKFFVFYIFRKSQEVSYLYLEPFRSTRRYKRKVLWNTPPPKKNWVPKKLLLEHRLLNIISSTPKKKPACKIWALSYKMSDL